MMSRFTLLGLALSPVNGVMAPVRVWDGLLAQSTLSTLLDAGEQRSHCFTSIMDRERHGRGRTIIETALTSILDELDDDARYVEYWWRGESKGMEAHRDVDEALCRSNRVNSIGVQRCPQNGHVLYLAISPENRGPTCVWEEQNAEERLQASVATTDGSDPRAGAPRPLQAVHVVPAQPGRLLRFDGAALHSVVGSSTEWLESVGATDAIGTSAIRRAVLLFNTWEQPPRLPSPDDPPAPRAVDSFAALGGSLPSCASRKEWTEVTAAVAPAVAMERTCLRVQLLGDHTRRNCEAPALLAHVERGLLRTAVEAASVPHVVALEPADELNSPTTTVGAVAEGGGKATAGEDAVLFDAEEELAMRLGHAEHLEEEFWGVDDNDDDDDDEYDEAEETEGVTSLLGMADGGVDGEDGEDDENDEDDEAGPDPSFWANVAAMQALEEKMRSAS